MVRQEIGDRDREHVVSLLKAGRPPALISDETGHPIELIQDLARRHLTRKERATHMATQITRENFDAWKKTPGESGKLPKGRGASVESWLKAIGSDVNPDEAKRMLGIVPGTRTSTGARAPRNPAKASNGANLGTSMDQIIPGFSERVRAIAAKASPEVSHADRVAEVLHRLDAMRKHRANLEIQIQILDEEMRRADARFRALLAGEDPEDDDGQGATTLDTSDAQTEGSASTGGKGGKGRKGR